MAVLKLLYGLAFAALIGGCATSRPEPARPRMPDTPASFLIQKHQPGDASNSCEKLTSDLRYAHIYRETVDRVFDAKGPSMARESQYTTTSGMAVRSGGVITANATSRTIGGNPVMVYDDLSLRARFLRESARERHFVVEELIRRRGDCDQEATWESGRALEASKSRQSSAEREVADIESVLSFNTAMESGLPSGDLKTQMVLNNARTKAELSSRRTLAVRAKAEYERRLTEHREMHARAEQTAQQQRLWFEQNTK